MFHRTVVLTFLDIFSYTCNWFVYLSLAVFPVGESTHCHSAMMYALGDWLNNPPLARYESKSLIEVGSEYISIILPSRRDSLDTNVDDLATTLDASEFCDTRDVGRLTSLLFSQEREVSAIPFSVSSSQTHSSMEKSRRDVEQFSSCGGTVVERLKKS